MSEANQSAATVTSRTTTQFIKIGTESGKSVYAKITIDYDKLGTPEQTTTFSLEVRLISRDALSKITSTDAFDAFKKLEELFEDAAYDDRSLRIQKAGFELFITPFSAQLGLVRSKGALIIQGLRSLSRDIQHAIQGDAVEPIAELSIGTHTYIVYRHSVFDSTNRYSLLTENGRIGNIKMTAEETVKSIIGLFNNGIIFS